MDKIRRIKEFVLPEFMGYKGRTFKLSSLDGYHFVIEDGWDKVERQFVYVNVLDEKDKLYLELSTRVLVSEI